MKTFNDASGSHVNVNFPFLDPHPRAQAPFRTNARESETFDHIGIFSRDPRLPTFEDNATMGQNRVGPDYGVFEFAELFSDAVLGRPLGDLSADEKKGFYARFEHKVSDHKPIWMRLPLPWPPVRTRS